MALLNYFTLTLWPTLLLHGCFAKSQLFRWGLARFERLEYFTAREFQKA